MLPLSLCLLSMFNVSQSGIETTNIVNHIQLYTLSGFMSHTTILSHRYCYPFLHIIDIINI